MMMPPTLAQLGPRFPQSDPDALRRDLEAAVAEAEGLGEPELARALRRLASLTEVWECLALDHSPAARELAEFLHQAPERLVADSLGLVQESSERWGDYLQLLDPGSPDTLDAPIEDEETPAEQPPAIDAEALLRLLGGGAPVREPSAGKLHAHPGQDALRPHVSPREESDDSLPSPPGEGGPKDRVRARLPNLGPIAALPHPAAARPPSPEGEGQCPSDAPRSDSRGPGIVLGSAEQRRPARDRPKVAPTPAIPQDLDPEFREAFLAEASDLFERVEELVMNLHRAPDSESSLRELGRCFHTLKGAAGSVGLVEFAGRIHALEDEIEGAPAPVPPALLELLHLALADFEATLTALRQGPGPQSTPFNAAPLAEPVVPESAPGPAATDPFLRIPGAKVDELLDHVSELITRRGVWTAQGETLRGLVATAQTCRNRLTATLDRLRDLGPGPRGELGRLALGLAEQSEDLAVLIQSAQAAVGPLTDAGDAFARVSLQLWDSLQALQIVPVRGLFHRLERVARDAAKIEGRVVEVVLVGEETGLDRAVQDKAFEPLLHVVRNAVGHGIEPAADRARAGKAPSGRVTLEARREGNTLVLAVHDDGRGLDYAAIEAKGRRLGLVGPADAPDVARLNALIFHSGFSTRPEANAISGRGVGMDVVAQEVARLRGSVELVSSPGRGTTLTVRLPTRLALERAMVVRLDGQAFSLPVESIEHAQPFDPADLEGAGAAATVLVRDRRVPFVSARSALGISATTPDPCPKLLLVTADVGSVGVLVDAIEGPRELVIKPLGSLLAGHPVLVGTSLSVTGEVVLAVNPSGLARRPRDAGNRAVAAPPAPPDRANAALVVDDSISVRRVAARLLNALGFAVDEVSDGLDALRQLRAHPYRLVLTDLEMPRMDGFELLAEMRRQGILDTVPVVVASTRTEPGSQRRAFDLGARAFLAKPIEPSELARAVEALRLGREDCKVSGPTEKPTAKAPRTPRQSQDEEGRGVDPRMTQINADEKDVKTIV